ncbi:beta-defensin 127 [Ochotona curzoniae]|uniref:beta-defensin 127 n=1 Tax=Ochotona curzoniae TaxID=130825 RepID=UPI001B34CB4A|nr:beta-defensin 127 [Ochotona curzoniae]
MNLFLIIAILLFQNPTETKQKPKKCWDEYVQGYCRKICKVTEIREVLCENGRYCCLNIKDVKARKIITVPPRPKPKTPSYTVSQEEYPIEENALIPTTNSST